MPNIGFYGHSNCAYRSDDSLIDILANNIGSTIVNTGVRQGSEERILFELKKTKDLDLAIIFHSEAQFIFVPNADRDISIKQITNSKSNYIFADHLNTYHQIHHKKFVELFKNPEELEAAVHYLKTYFYHPDLQLNRFYGSLIQIDQYLTTKRIPAIHVVSPNTIPNWFKFTSGIVDTEIIQLVKSHALIAGEWFVNIINKEGNRAIAKRLQEIIEDNGIMEEFPLIPATVA
jgi:hypothetical protein